MPLTIAELRDEIGNHLQDPAHFLIQRQQLLEFINSAAWDAANGDWLLPKSDESLETAASTFEYAIPSGFEYVHDIWLESSTSNQFDERILRNQWKIGLVSTTATLIFDSVLFTITVTRNLKLDGHARPTTEYTSDTDNVDVGLESFIRERAVAYGARNLARHGGQHAATYAALFQEAYQTSADMLANRPEQYRLHLRSRHVPGA